MITQQQKITSGLIDGLFQLANTPFRLADWREQWAKFGWTHHAKMGDAFGFRVTIPGGPWLTVDPLGEAVECAMLPFFWWEDFSLRDHPDRASYDAARQAYEDAFSGACSMAERALPPAVARWRDDDKDGHQARVWEGRHGLLILQQACFDPQFGIELNFWLMEGTRKDFAPTTPLIDWLGQRSKAVHDQRGFPPVV